MKKQRLKLGFLLLNMNKHRYNKIGQKRILRCPKFHLLLKNRTMKQEF